VIYVENDDAERLRASAEWLRANWWHGWRFVFALLIIVMIGLALTFCGALG
jgi:hypothetical protein